RDALISCGAVRFGDFTLASGAKSSYYVDIKRASTDPKVLRLMGEGLAQKVGGAQRIAGMELGAVPLAAAAALASGVPFLMVRKKAKDHGTASRIEGPYAAGEEVVVVEDVTTSGGSSLEAVRVLREAGLRVTKVVTVVDRQQGAEKAFADAGVALESLVTAKELLEARA
ncbi:MAG TPA: orotate phosphoribosyltransferase, partial [Candidatus Thermoplasmatota archaeon]|nr:orotate phosphoribosyltransferase [Candidatus Thermoplasmatota archaeon]